MFWPPSYWIWRSTHQYIVKEKMVMLGLEDFWWVIIWNACCPSDCLKSRSGNWVKCELSPKKIGQRFACPGKGDSAHCHQNEWLLGDKCQPHTCKGGWVNFIFLFLNNHPPSPHPARLSLACTEQRPVLISLLMVDTKEFATVARSVTLRVTCPSHGG